MVLSVLSDLVVLGLTSVPSRKLSGSAAAQVADAGVVGKRPLTRMASLPFVDVYGEWLARFKRIQRSAECFPKMAEMRRLE